jgi:hypothetical protein
MLIPFSLGHHFDCIDARGVKRLVFLNVGDRPIRMLVYSNGEFRFRSAMLSSRSGAATSGLPKLLILLAGILHS